MAALFPAGLPDLVPHLGVFDSSVRYYPYIDRLPMYYIRSVLVRQSSMAYVHIIGSCIHMNCVCTC